MDAVRVGYCLFAILFLMFDVETAFLFLGQMIIHDMGPQGLVSILFFFVILVLGALYAWRKELWNGKPTKTENKINSV